jgi:TonB-dependent starch-binding outer membrane protein SusC
MKHLLSVTAGAVFALGITLGVPPSALEAQEAGTIIGLVVDATNQRPISGAQVSVPAANLGTLARTNGRFILLNVPAGPAEVRVEFIGYGTATQTVEVPPGGTVEANFQIRQEALGLDEIVVTGTAGQARRREVGNTISQINLAQVAEPVSSVDNLLSGRATAMTVNPGAATMGAGAQIRLRGNVSMTQSNQPLVYVDGVRQGTDAYPLNASQGAQFWQTPQSTAGPLNDINPNDIDRIEIVKGAAATTLYGSEAAGGVIQIFTKRGRDGHAQWTYQTNQRFDRVQAFGPDVAIPPFADGGPRPAETWSYVQMDPFLKTAWTQDHSLSVSGGTAGVRYFLSGLLTDGEGVHPNDEEFRGSVRGNITIQPRNDLSIDWNTAYTTHDMGITHSGNNLYALQFNAMRTPGNTVGSADPAVIGQLLDAKITQLNTRLNTGITATYAPRADFTHRLTVGIDRSTTEMSHRTPFGFILLQEGSLSEQRWVNEALSVDYVGSFDFGLTEDIGSRLSWGAQNVTREENMVDGWGQNFPGPGEHTLNAAATRLSFSTGFRTIDAGAFLQNMFSMHDRYFLTIGARMDGNSTFGEDLGLQVYPKASASWVISDEDFWNDGWGNFRFRGAYGHAGRAPGPFDATRTWSPLSFAGASAFLPANVGNPDLGPERTKELEVGFESSFSDDRFRLDFTYYDMETEDALFGVTQVPSMGFTGSQLQNIGRISNSGIEVGFTAGVMNRPSFSWDFGVNLSTNSSEVLDTGGQTYFTIVEGQPAPVIRGTKILNRNEFADPEIERDAFFGPNQPTRIIGLTSEFGFPHGMRLVARGEYQGGAWITQSSQWAMANRGGGAPGCANAYHIVGHRDYASASADQIARLRAWERGQCYNDNLEAGMWQEPADFFKLRELTFLVPVDNLVRVAETATLTLSARNIRIWTHKDFTAFDPEMVWAREGIRGLTSGIPEATPAPMQFTASMRVTF